MPQLLDAPPDADLSREEVSCRIRAKLEAYRKDALLFVRECIAPELISPDQEAVLRAVQPNARISIVSGHPL